MKFGGKERERRGSSVLSLICVGDASWWPESLNGEGTGGLHKIGEQIVTVHDGEGALVQVKPTALRIASYNGRLPRRFA